MNRMELGRIVNFNGWKAREGEVSLKDFQRLPQSMKDEYVMKIIDIPEEERSNIEKHIIRFHVYGPKPNTEKRFYTLDLE